MKKLLLAVAILLATVGSAAAQQSEKNYQVSGNVWSAVGGGSRAAKDTLVTNEYWQYKDGTKCQIILSASGRAYCWKRSAKSGQMYKAYISNEVAREICKKYGRTFVEPKQQSK